MFKDDFHLMNSNKAPESVPDKAFCHLICEGVTFQQDMFVFNNQVRVDIGKVHVIENERLLREVILISEPTFVLVDIWSINSPTMTDCEMSNKVQIGGRPILLYDPLFIKDLVTFLRNVGDQN